MYPNIEPIMRRMKKPKQHPRDVLNVNVMGIIPPLGKIFTPSCVLNFFRLNLGKKGTIGKFSIMPKFSQLHEG